jgi:hypothetical protein
MVSAHLNRMALFELCFSRLPIETPKEQQKLIRYRDDKIVSTKGEKMLVEKSSDDHLKHTYVSLRPLRRWRFH